MFSIELSSTESAEVEETQACEGVALAEFEQAGEGLIVGRGFHPLLPSTPLSPPLGNLTEGEDP